MVSQGIIEYFKIIILVLFFKENKVVVDILDLVNGELTFSCTLYQVLLQNHNKVKISFI